MISENLNDMLRTIAEVIRLPVVVLLIVLIAATIVLLGSLIAEVFTERRRLNAAIPALVDKIKDRNVSLKDTIAEAGLLRRQKTLLTELADHPDISPVMREAMARQLLKEEKSHYDTLLRLSDIIARVGPMLGLLGTLIPLGPGLIALGQGDTYTLSQSLLTAFDTTTAGLAAAAVCFVISSIRRVWYEHYMSLLEALAECVLDREADGCEKE